MKLGWDDILIQNPTSAETEAWLADWTFLDLGRVAPICLSRFGDWFLLRPSGEVFRLDVLEFQFERLAPSFDSFQTLLNDTDWQHDILLSWLVADLHDAGVVAGKRQCYGFAPHPVFTGQISKERVSLLDTMVWQSICAQTWKSCALPPSNSR